VLVQQNACMLRAVALASSARARARAQTHGKLKAVHEMLQKEYVKQWACAGEEPPARPSLPAGLMGAPCAACSVVCFLHGVVFLTRLRMVQPPAPVPDVCIPGSPPS